MVRTVVVRASGESFTNSFYTRAVAPIDYGDVMSHMTPEEARRVQDEAKQIEEASAALTALLAQLKAEFEATEAAYKARADAFFAVQAELASAETSYTARKANREAYLAARTELEEAQKAFKSLQKVDYDPTEAEEAREILEIAKACGDTTEVVQAFKELKEVLERKERSKTYAEVKVRLDKAQKAFEAVPGKRHDAAYAEEARSRHEAAKARAERELEAFEAVAAKRRDLRKQIATARKARLQTDTKLQDLEKPLKQAAFRLKIVRDRAERAKRKKSPAKPGGNKHRYAVAVRAELGLVDLPERGKATSRDARKRLDFGGDRVLRSS